MTGKPSLLFLVATRPEGDKVNVAAIARELGMAQADVVASIQKLVDDGDLGRTTLRQSLIVRAPNSDEVMTADLSREVAAFLERSGVAPTSLGKLMTGERGFVARIARPGAIVTAATAAKARAFMATWVPPAKVLTGADLADQLEALIAKHDLARHRLTLHLFGPGYSISQLRAVKNPKRKTADKVQVFLADPDVERFHRRREFETPQADSIRSRRSARQARGIDMRANAGRKAARTEAQRVLDKNPDAIGGRNATITQAIGELRRQAAEEARRADPIEHAKLALRRRGRIVHDASVRGGKVGRFNVSGEYDEERRKLRQLTARELTDLAWRVNPLEMERLTGAKRHVVA